MLVEKTLKTLARAHFNGFLWLVVPSEEMVEYQQAVLGNQITCMIVHCERGLTKQRKHFRSTMLPGTEIVFIDDDIEALKIKGPEGLRHCASIELVAHYVFQSMYNYDPDCLLAGVYPMCNRDWMKSTITRDNSYVVGALYFCKNDDRLVEPEESELEDWARCLGEQAAGRPVLRFNFIGIQTKYWENAGGLQNTDRATKRATAIEDLVLRNPTIIKPVVRRNGKPDLKFLKKPLQWTEAVLPS